MKLQLRYIDLDFKSECLFRTCCVATDLLTSHQFHSNLCFYAVPFMASYRTIPYSLFFTPIAALLQAVLQANAEPLGNGLVETRNLTVKTSKSFSTGPQWSKMMIEYGLRAWNVTFFYFFMKSDEILLLSSIFGKDFDLCLYYYLLCRRGNKHFHVHFWRIRLVLFPPKGGKDVAYQGRNEWKVFFSLQSRHQSSL